MPSDLLASGSTDFIQGHWVVLHWMSAVECVCEIRISRGFSKVARHLLRAVMLQLLVEKEAWQMGVLLSNEAFARKIRRKIIPFRATKTHLDG